MKDGKPLPSVTYQTGEHKYYYTTDSMGRITKIQAPNLQYKLHADRLDHNPDTVDKQDFDHAGHLIADLFGGSPELDNLVSQWSKVNQKFYRNIERFWDECLAEGISVSVDISIEYGDGMRPEAFHVYYIIDDTIDFYDIISNNPDDYQKSDTS